MKPSKTMKKFLSGAVKGLGLMGLSAIVTSMPDSAFALGGGGGTSVEWEGPLETIANSLSGPVAFFISLLGLVAAGGALLFGGEINEFTRRIIMLVLVISMLVFATSILGTVFGVGLTIDPALIVDTGAGK